MQLTAAARRARYNTVIPKKQKQQNNAIKYPMVCGAAKINPPDVVLCSFDRDNSTQVD